MYTSILINIDTHHLRYPVGNRCLFTVSGQSFNEDNQFVYDFKFSFGIFAMPLEESFDAFCEFFN